MSAMRGHAIIAALSGLSGLAWGAIAHAMGGELPLPLACGAGGIVGIVIGLASGPWRDAEWPATLMLSLVGLYVAVALFTALVSAYMHLASGRPPLRLPLVMVNSMLAATWGLSLTGFMFVLWPFAFLNHAAVWWYARRSDGRP